MLSPAHGTLDARGRHLQHIARTQDLCLVEPRLERATDRGALIDRDTAPRLRVGPIHPNLESHAAPGSLPAQVNHLEPEVGHAPADLRRELSQFLIHV